MKNKKIYEIYIILSNRPIMPILGVPEQNRNGRKLFKQIMVENTLNLGWKRTSRSKKPKRSQLEGI